MMEMNCAKYLYLCIAIAIAGFSEATNDTSLENCRQHANWSVYIDFASEAIEKATNRSVTCHDTVGECGQKESLMSYLRVAAEMINKAKIYYPTCDTCNKTVKPQQVARDCSDLFLMGHKSSGVYSISHDTLTKNESIDVYCDMKTDGGGWTVIQRRDGFQIPVEDFYQDWKTYKEGFGDVDKEFWLGNDEIFALTNQRICSARFDLEDFEKNTAHAHYEEFRIDDESNMYTLHVSNYSGDAGDSLVYDNNAKFSTKDKDNDHSQVRHYAKSYDGAWWFYSYIMAHLNGPSLVGKQKYADGKIWSTWKEKESLARTEIKIRPKNFKSLVEKQQSVFAPM